MLRTVGMVATGTGAAMLVASYVVTALISYPLEKMVVGGFLESTFFGGLAPTNIGEFIGSRLHDINPCGLGIFKVVTDPFCSIWHRQRSIWSRVHK